VAFELIFFVGVETGHLLSYAYLGLYLSCPYHSSLGCAFCFLHLVCSRHLHLLLKQEAVPGSERPLQFLPGSVPPWGDAVARVVEEDA